MKPMKSWTRAAVVILAGLFATLGLHALPNGSGGGSGGGHGGSGGHGGGGFSSGHASGTSTGRGVGHSIGHSLGRLFGRQSKTQSSTHELAPPLADTPVLHGNVVQLLPPHLAFTPVSRKFPRQPIGNFPFAGRFLFFPAFGFGFGGCAGYGSPFYPFFFNNDFDCFSGGYSFDPFLTGAYSASFIGGPSYSSFSDRWPDYVPGDSAEEPHLAQPSDVTESSGNGDNPQYPAIDNAVPTAQAKSEPPATLLQLRDGSMYGLVGYSAADGQLHYTTTYGAQNSVALDRIDLEKTVQLNAERGIQFVLPAR